VRISTHPTARIATTLIDQIAKAVGPGAAQRWFLNADPALGIECSPLMALKAGREQEVRDHVKVMLTELEAVCNEKPLHNIVGRAAT
jgi:hypothetical protein